MFLDLMYLFTWVMSVCILVFHLLPILLPTFKMPKNHSCGNLVMATLPRLGGCPGLVDKAGR